MTQQFLMVYASGDKLPFFVGFCDSVEDIGTLGLEVTFGGGMTVVFTEYSFYTVCPFDDKVALLLGDFVRRVRKDCS